MSDAELMEQTIAGLDLDARLSQLVIASYSPAAGEGEALGSQIAMTRPALGGVWIEGGDARSVAELAQRVGSASGVPLLIGGDLDQGIGSLVGAGSELPPIGHLLSAVGENEIEEVADVLGAEARQLGLHFGAIRAPATTGGFPYSLMERDEEPEMLRRLLDNAKASGIPLALALFRAPPEAGLVRWDRARLEAFELPLLEAARDDGAALLLDGSAFPALTGDTSAISTSRAVYASLRREHDWRVPIIADLRGAVYPAGSAVAALAAGADMVIVRGETATVTNALREAVENGRLPAPRVEAAVRRILLMKSALIPPRPTPAEGRPQLADPLEQLQISRTEHNPLVTSLSARLATDALGADLSRDHRPVLLLRRNGEAESFAAALRERLRVVELPAELSADSASSWLASNLTAGARTVVVSSSRKSRVELDSILRLIPDSITAIGLWRVGFGEEAVPGATDRQQHLFSWGTGHASQQAVATLITTPETEARQAPSYRSTLSRLAPNVVGMDEQRVQRVDRILREALAHSVFTGAAIVVARRGGAVLMRGYGSAGGGGPVDPASTLFDIASLSKVVGTTAAAASLMESGELELDAPVRRYIPEFRGDDKQDVTIRHLLSHTAGLPPGLELYYTANSREQALEQVIRQRLRRPPGRQEEYSDLGMILLAEVIERASETPLDRLLARRIFTPLGMSSTMYLPPLALRANSVPSAANTERPFVLQGVVHDGNAYRLGGVTGHAGLFSTALDLAVFSQMMLNEGVYGSTRIFEAETVRELTRRQPNAGERALGWDTPADRSSAGRFLSSSSYGHTGYTGTSIWIDPLRELFVVLLTNRTYSNASSSEILQLRIDVHEAAVQAISDRSISRRPGAR